MANRYGTQSYRRDRERRGERDYRSGNYDRERYGNRDTERQRYGSDYAGYGRGSGYGHEDESRYMGGSYGRGYGSYNHDYDEDTITGSYMGGRSDDDRGRYRRYSGDYSPDFRRGESRGGRRDYSEYNRYDRENDRQRYGDRYNEEDRTWLDRAGDEVASWFGDEDAERRRQMDARQQGQGQHRGRGPRNYKRSDERIKEDINDRLTDHDYLDASDIDVEVNNGDVILTGKVDSRSAKRLAEDVAEEVTGVGNVENRIRVQQSYNGPDLWPTTGNTSDTATTTGTTGTTDTTTGETTTSGRSRSRAV
jgi:osmotically-inducible protein OsmY